MEFRKQIHKNSIVMGQTTKVNQLYHGHLGMEARQRCDVVSQIRWSSHSHMTLICAQFVFGRAAPRPLRVREIVFVLSMDFSFSLEEDSTLCILTHSRRWNLEDRRKIILTLEKARHTWWNCFLEGDETIDTTKVGLLGLL